MAKHFLPVPRALRIVPGLLGALRLIGMIFSQAFAATSELRPNLFARTNLAAWCIVPFDRKERGPEERAAMLEKLGITMLAYDYRAKHIPTFDAEIEALANHHIRLLA